jgi:hypothetical protein
VERAAATLQREFQNALLSVIRRREISDGNPFKFLKRAATGGESGRKVQKHVTAKKLKIVLPSITIL